MGIWATTKKPHHTEAMVIGTWSGCNGIGRIFSKRISKQRSYGKLKWEDDICNEKISHTLKRCKQGQEKRKAEINKPMRLWSKSNSSAGSYII